MQNFSASPREMVASLWRNKGLIRNLIHREVVGRYKGSMLGIFWSLATPTTRENALQVAALLGKRCEEPWLLVTSAWHMPRSVPEFEAVGCQVTPYPVDFRTGDTTLWTEYSLARSLLLWQTALHEWLGLGVYRVTR